MNDESHSISAKSWARAADSINKVGFMDGAANGQKTEFQPSFDTGYKQGFRFGLELGIEESKLRFHNKRKSLEMQLKDTRRINCQICLNSSTAQKDIFYLYYQQQEKNNEYLNEALK